MQKSLIVLKCSFGKMLLNILTVEKGKSGRIPLFMLVVGRIQCLSVDMSGQCHFAPQKHTMRLFRNSRV